MDQGNKLIIVNIDIKIYVQFFFNPERLGVRVRAWMTFRVRFMFKNSWSNNKVFKFWG